jgi:hypothetical protein
MTPFPPPHERRRPAVALAALLAVSFSVIAASCSEPEEHSLCASFDRMVASVDSIRAEVTGETAGELSDQADALLQRVTALQEVADGRYTAELDAFEETLDNLVRTLASIQEDAEYDTWAPLVDDSLEDVNTAATRVEEAIAPSCSPGVSAVSSTENSDSDG